MKTLKEYSTKELHEELAKRLGVREIIVDVDHHLTVFDKVGEVAMIEGPVRIIINID